MIYEYALEPKLVVDWAVAKIGRYVRQFGLDQRRLVSDFPKDWKNFVIGAFYEHFGYDDTSLEFQNTQRDLDAYLQFLTDYMVYRNIKVPLDCNWLDAALVEHNSRPFYAIFASKSSNHSLPEVITENNIEDIHNAYWWLPTVKPTRKSAVEIATALRPLLQASREIHLVDPYFDFDPKEPRFLNTLIEIINQLIGSHRAVQCTPSIRIITGVERNGKTNDQEAKNFAKNICERAKRAIQYLPNGISIQLTVLKNATQGNPLHNRFLLTDIGGVIIPYGLDDYDREPDHGAEDDLEPMHKGTYEKRWKQYVKLCGVQKVLGPVSICGPSNPSEKNL